MEEKMYRRYRTPSIWQEMRRIQDEMDRLSRDFSPRFAQSKTTYPAVNIWADEESAIITAEIPGVSQDGLNINVTGDTLTLGGARIPEELPEGAKYHRQERSYGEFSRSIRLPFTVDVNKVKASFKNGILEIFLPRIEAEKPKKISVKSA
jgi:HSP20 family protein